MSNVTLIRKNIFLAVCVVIGVYGTLFALNTMHGLTQSDSISMLTILDARQACYCLAGLCALFTVYSIYNILKNNIYSPEEQYGTVTMQHVIPTSMCNER